MKLYNKKKHVSMIFFMHPFKELFRKEISSLILISF